MTRVLIVDDHELIAAGIASALAEHTAQIDTAQTYKSATEQLAKSTYDIVFIDLQLDDDEGDGRDLKIWMNQKAMKSQTICMSSAFTPMKIDMLGQLKFDGFYSKSDPVEQLIAAVESLAHDGVFHSQTVIDLIDRLKTAPALTRRQKELMQLVAAGDSNKDIAFKMKVTEATVAFHMTQLKSRLGVTNAREIGARGRELGLLD